MFEAVVDSTTITGEVSQSAQWAPFDPYYQVGIPLLRDDRARKDNFNAPSGEGCGGALTAIRGTLPIEAAARELMDSLTIPAPISKCTMTL